MEFDATKKDNLAPDNFLTRAEKIKQIEIPQTTRN